MSDVTKISEHDFNQSAVLWCFSYMHEVTVRSGDDFHESITIETIHAEYHVIAVTEALARAAYELHRPAHVYTLVSHFKVCVVDAIVSANPTYRRFT